MDDAIYYYPRHSDKLEQEIVMGERYLKWAYQSPRARWLEGLLFRSRLPSKIMGWYFDSPLSRGKIQHTIRELQINSDEFLEPPEQFRSFNQFFTRRLKPESRPVATDDDILISPADGRILVYPELDAGQVIPIKGAVWRINDLLAGEAPDFSGGSVAVIRLCPADYHRFHFPCDAEIRKRVADIPGNLHSVNPVALCTGINVFTENKRCWTWLNSPLFGDLAMVEVGAFGVGSITWTFQGDRVKKMAEKGYFSFGGSSIILIFQPGRIRFAADLVRHSAKGYESLIHVGEELARSSRPAHPVTPETT